MNRKKTHPNPDEAPAQPAPAAAPEAPAAASAAAPAPATPPPLPAPSPLEAELTALKDKHLRLMADFDNFRKRQARERDDYARRATEALLEELLPVLDHLDLALANAPSKTDPLVTGVRMVSDQFKGALAKFELKPFDAAGQLFDPARHEAVSELPSAEVPAHHVLHQLRCGYLLGNRLLRAARVVVSSGPTTPPATPPAASEPVCEAAAQEPPKEKA
jgi:molecular chaperone GrpE